MELKLYNDELKGGALRLLIVPYGIETYLDDDKEENDGLLIVPYGIETLYRSKKLYTAA